MATLKSQIENLNIEYLKRESEQECNIIERKMATNGSGTEFILVEFFSVNFHPYDAKGITVLVIESDGYAYLYKSYLKSIFNR